MGHTWVNIACGLSFVEGWQNFDYEPASSAVTRANLLGRLPLDDGVADAVYCSHFLEHIPRARIDGFLAECFRIMRPGGRIRLVLPDLEELCREYLRQRDAGAHEKADFVVLEMLDQCVRTRTGGELGDYFGLLARSGGADMKAYVADRTGASFPEAGPERGEAGVAGRMRKPLKIREHLQRIYCRALTRLLPAAFLEQNVSFAGIGERHAWVYDFHGLSALLERAGFIAVQKMQYDRSEIEKFPLQALDLASSGRPRKGRESMYVEARKAP